jgi:hypothetical protein
MAWCERAAYDISFIGVGSNYLPGAGDIGSAVHRIVQSYNFSSIHPF